MFNIQTVGRISAMAAAAALSVTAIVPASAATSDPAAASTAPAKAKRPTRYCVENVVPGSNIVRKTCKTRDEWIKAEGFDPVRHR
jgi:hypothetical protein